MIRASRRRHTRADPSIVSRSTASAASRTPRSTTCRDVLIRPSRVRQRHDHQRQLGHGHRSQQPAHRQQHEPEQRCVLRSGRRQLAQPRWLERRRRRVDAVGTLGTVPRSARPWLQSERWPDGPSGSGRLRYELVLGRAPALALAGRQTSTTSTTSRHSCSTCENCDSLAPLTSITDSPTSRSLCKSIEDMRRVRRDVSVDDGEGLGTASDWTTGDP